MERVDSPLEAGVGKVDITPDPAMINWVSGKAYTGVLDPLYARALVLRTGEVELAWIAWDLIDSHEEAVAAVRKAITRSAGIPPERVLITASHTHSGPRASWTGQGELLALAAPKRRERMQSVAQDPVYRAWCEKLPERVAAAVRQAQSTRVPAAIAIGRADAGEWLFNRRPVAPDGTCVSILRPQDPKALPHGLRFGPVDPTLTTLVLTGPGGRTVATLFNLPCHAVSVYVESESVSADWPGLAAALIAEALGGEALFLTGCGGEIVPARRGLAARQEMARFFAQRAVAAAKLRHPLPAAPLKTARAQPMLPLADDVRRLTGRDAWPAEVNAVACGDLALVTFPGEPLNGIAREVQRRSPFPHTVVVGYTNGWGIGYVGLPGEKARGGYESTAGKGSDTCGQLLIECAARLLAELR